MKTFFLPHQPLFYGCIWLQLAKSHFALYQNLHTLSHSNCTNLHSHKLHKGSWGGGGGLHPQSSPAAADENTSTKTWSAWGGKVTNLSEEKGLEHLLPWVFIEFSSHRDT